MGHWQRVELDWKVLFREALTILPNFQWLFMANLQTYVLAPNLCALKARLQSSSEPLLIARPMLIKNEPFPSPFAGQLYNRQAVMTFYERSHQFKDILKGGDVARRLADAGFFVRDSRDEHGRERFHSFTILGASDSNPTPYAHSYKGWFADYSFYGFKDGMECCAATSIAFHYLDIAEMRAFHFALTKAAKLRAERSNAEDADLDEQVFGESWPADKVLNAYGHVWRDPKFLPKRVLFPFLLPSFVEVSNSVLVRCSL
eukprot:TRINITY_DN37295_c0_g1_i3.p1 TRINITY_DN37295_c0_g1~~TRINITY_DN37295_c0_g1_i3.p1  ORF type:complete len:259 (+),score=41.23 TRINITY_DN37295_c0_g1_i3:469-1245(+)